MTRKGVMITTANTSVRCGSQHRALGDAQARNSWASSARCRSHDPDELFVRGAAQKRAAVICRHCSVVVECAAEALDNRMEFGVWGGMTETSTSRAAEAAP